MKRRTQTLAIGSVLGAPVLLVLGITLAAAASGALTVSSSPQATNCSGPPVTAGKTVAGQQLTQGQISNAQVIYSVGTSMHLPQRAAVVAIATAMQESRLEDLSYGDRDSIGLFQQRPSQGWGTVAQIMQPAYAARAFYSHLEQVAGWQSLPVTVAAQLVQASAFPDAYAQWQGLATSLVSTFSGEATYCLTGKDSSVPSSGSTSLPKGYRIPPGTPAPASKAIRYAIKQLGKPYIWGGTGPRGFDCSGLVMMAYRAGGISLPRTTYAQVGAGTPVYSVGQLRAGDLIFTAGADGTPSDPGHVGLYLGSGLVLEAPQTGESVKVDSLAGYWSKSAVAMRRIAV